MGTVFREQRTPVVIYKMGLIAVTGEEIDDKTILKIYLIIFLIFLMVFLVICCRYFRARRIRRQNQEKGVKTITESNQDEPPSYASIFFSEDPPAFKKMYSGHEDNAR